MKCLLKSTFLLIISAIFIYTVSACSLIDDGSSDITPSETTNLFYTEHALIDSNYLAEQENVTVSYGEHAEKFATLKEAAETVKRSSVAITVDNYAGSGVIVDISDDTLAENEYYIITCNHMVENTGSIITVYLPDANYRYGEDENYIFTGRIGFSMYNDNAVTLVGGDHDSDVAVLKIKITDAAVRSNIYKAKVMSPEYVLEYAEPIFAIGNPSGGLPGSYSEGAVGYLDRVTSVGGIGKMTLIQISLFSNPGSSGGGLYNAYGELVGITSSGNTEYEGLNFAIPHHIESAAEIDNGFVNIALNLIGSYAATGGRNHGYISGRRFKIGYSFSETTNGKVAIVAVNSGSLAESAGLKTGDVLSAIKINGTGANNKVTGYEMLSELLNGLEMGETYQYTIIRDSKQYTVTFGVYQYYLYDTGFYLEA